MKTTDQMENNPKAKTGSLAGTFVKRPYPALLEVIQAEAEVGLKPARKPKRHGLRRRTGQSKSIDSLYW